jgi:glycosyltransferase involved in cell wall biosynthesis
MEKLDVDIVMLLPTSTESVEKGDEISGDSRLRGAALKSVIVRTVPSKLPNPYQKIQPIRQVRVLGTGQAGGYDGNLIERVYEYALRCTEMVKADDFDVIHAHDWVTFPAAVALSAALQKPLVVHIHATEFDRSGQGANRAIYDIERQGMEAASAVIAVSNYTANVLVHYYGVPFNKIHVVYNGINHKPAATRPFAKRREAIVLFLGRITAQKGPEFFVKAAEQVLRRYDNVKFVMAGWGDLASVIVEMVAARRLGSRIFFTGFLRGQQVDIAYQMSDLYIMPSVSEPFGLTALEAVRHGLPVIISKTTGVGEILCNGALKVDFWDINKMAGQIVEVLTDARLAERLRTNASNEIRNLTWEAAAGKCISVYNDVVQKVELAGRDN